MTGPAARLVLRWPRSLLALLLVAGALLVVRLPDLAVDVSARTLLGAPHAAVDAWRDTARMFHLPEQLVVTVAAPGGVRNAATRALLEHLQKDIAGVPGVAAVNSVLDAPLLRQVHGPLAQLENNRRTLRSADVDYDKARAELIDSPLFREVLISADGRNTALLVSLRATDEGADVASRGATLAALRDVLKPYATQAEVGLSGAAVVADEVARAVTSDLARLPVLVLSVMLLLIAAATRRPPVLEFACGSFAVLTTAGLWQTLFGALGAVPAAALPLVVVIAVLLSFTLRVSYKLHVSQTDSDDPHDVLAATVEHALRASLPASGVLLLMAATLSLSPLHPAHQLGVLLLCGLGCAWLAAFGLGPCLLAVARRRPQALSPVPVVVPARWLSIGLAAVLAAAAVGGVPRFIHEAGLAAYLPRASAARDALRTVEHLYGGALTFDLVLTLPPVKVATPAPAVVADSPYREATGDSNEDDTWFTSERVRHVEAVHRWLQAQPGVGRVLSLASLLEVGQQLNDGTPLSPFELNLMYKRLPRAVRQSLIDPFVQPNHDAVRLEVRMRDATAWHDARRAAVAHRTRTCGALQVTGLGLSSERRLRGLCPHGRPVAADAGGGGHPVGAGQPRARDPERTHAARGLAPADADLDSGAGRDGRGRLARHPSRHPDGRRQRRGLRAVRTDPHRRAAPGRQPRAAGVEERQRATAARSLWQHRDQPRHRQRRRRTRHARHRRLCADRALRPVVRRDRDLGPARLAARARTASPQRLTASARGRAARAFAYHHGLDYGLGPAPPSGGNEVGGSHEITHQHPT
ncbi:MAG: MMPL family transporter [Proteobacteria bacterium]|nr:MMPL family transporter [Pseudomonadota bacterium]